MKILKTVLIYMLCIFIILVIFVISCHYITLNKHPEDIQILQAETPDFDKIQALLTQNQPTVLDKYYMVGIQLFTYLMSYI